MNDPLTFILCWLSGGVIGAIFFGGLWWTVRKGVSSPNPAFWFLGSILLRTGIALAGFYFVSDGQWKRLVACLLGFIMARLGVIWLIRSAREHRSTSEATHAS